MVSFQFAKNEYGEKTFKPLVNLHVTPNENIINKVGALFKQKKFGGSGDIGGAPYNQHYHTHTHYPGPSYHHPHHYETIPPHFDGSPHHFESGPNFEHPPHHFSTGPGGYYPSGYANDYEFSSPGYYHDSYHSTNNIDSSLAITGPSSYESFEPNAHYSRSANVSTIGQATYADNYVNYNHNFAEQQQQQYQSQNIAQAKIGQDNQKQGTATQSVSFPKNRRKRNANSDIERNKQSIAPKSNRLEKVKYNTCRINQSDRSLKNKQTKTSSRNDIALTQR